MDITLISPYLDICSYGIRSISSVLRGEGFKTRLIFLHDIKALLKNSPDFPRRYHPNVLKGVVDLCEDSDLVGISLMSNYYDRSLELTRAIKARLDVPVIWGGVHPTLMPEECVELADLVCVGEGEYALLDFMKKRKNGGDYYDSKNFWFRRDGETVKNPLMELIQDLNAIPIQDISLEEHYALNWEQDRIIPMDDGMLKSLIMEGLALGEGKHFFQVIATRGCPHKCSYCCNYAIEALYPGQKHIRRRSVKNLIDELVYLKERMPYLELFAFTDDSFLAARMEWLEEFRDEYKSKVGLPFFCLTSPVTINRKKLELIVDMGLHIIEVGMQTGSEKTKSMYNRNIPNEKVVEAAWVLNEFKDRIFPPVYDVILDNPFETVKDKLETIKLMHSLPHPKIFQYFSLTFYPGTLVLKMAQEAGIVKDIVEDVYRKYYFSKDYNYINFLYLLAEKKIPSWLFSILSHPALVHILNLMIPGKFLKELIRKIQGRK